MIQLKKATKKQVKLRLGLSSVSGGGKTYSALLIAYGICKDWSKIAVIDTENDSASLYSDIGEYNTISLKPPYAPEKYIECINVCQDAGMEVIIIDSISHEWDGTGGCLDIQSQMGGKYQDWAKVTPRHQAFIDSILQSSCHVITTVRRKQDYEMTKDSNGRLKVEKAGLKEVTREGFEYELTLNLELDTKHYASASKDRTGLFLDKHSFIPTIETGEIIKKWCDSGESIIEKKLLYDLVITSNLNDMQKKVANERIEKIDSVSNFITMENNLLKLQHTLKPSESIKIENL